MVDENILTICYNVYMRDFLKNLGKSILIIVACLGVGLAGLLVAASISSSRITKVAAQEGSETNTDAGASSLDAPVSTNDAPGTNSATSSDLSPASTDTSTSIASETSVLAATRQDSANNQIHWIILGIDGFLLLALILALAIRLLSKLFSQPAMQQPIAFNGQQSQQPVTIDQLDVDIPL